VRSAIYGAFMSQLGLLPFKRDLIGQKQWSCIRTTFAHCFAGAIFLRAKKLTKRLRT